ncbi:UDP-4-amino-4,6-dideoxy-N-acetyl-beta-L-altrosamine transaminase [Candidatus Atribacteria bacterium HGW-Atribacteria-1]|nr:MAG: UDP-4-amino-4,6-dideoxy-N-acetyl-beta-L-altrosamine transaminase [Candidatus Atribacteria bacterium HGW-Atribacteria-1]
MPAIEGGKVTRNNFLPFARPLIGQEDIEEVVDTLNSDWLTTGPKTHLFEEEFAKYIGCKYAVAVNSCTAALHISLAALGIGKGDEVITTPYTFISTVNVILQQGAIPVFVDIKPDTFNINPDLIREKINDKTKAIMPVHFAGQPCEMEKIMKIAKDNNLLVIEDAAHAISAEYEGRKIGTIGDATSFSFYPTKNMTTGEGGMVTTNDEKLRERLKVWGLHGISKDAWKRYSAEGSWYYEVVCPGYKYNMTDIQASLGLHQLEKLNNFQKKRENIVKAYNEAFKDMKEITIPFVKNNIKHAWHLYVIKIVSEKLKINRNQFIEALKAENIGTSVHFIPAHLQPYYRDTFGFKKGDFPNAEYAFERVISLPLFPKMSDKDVKDVINSVKKIVEYYKK